MDDLPPFLAAAPEVVWERLSRFLFNEAVAPRGPLPTRTTPAWAKQITFALLDEAEAEGSVPAGIVQFMGSWMLGHLEENSPMWLFPPPWAAELGRKDAVLANLLAAEAGLGSNGIFTDKAFGITFQTPSTRGGQLLRRLFCQEVPPPPAGLNITLGPLTPGQTRREWLENELGMNAACAGCHRLMDPLGYALENYDPMGDYRTMENGEPIDASGQYRSPRGEEFVFDSIADLAPQVASSCEVATCFARTWFDDALTRSQAPVAASTYDERELQHVLRPFASSGFSFRALIGGIVTAPSFLRE